MNLKTKSNLLMRTTMNNLLPSTLMALLILFFSMPLSAQEGGCIDFEDFPAGPVFGPGLGNSPGDTLFAQDGLVATAEAFLYLNGQTGFLNASIFGDNVGWLDGQFLFLSNNALQLSYEEPVQEVCFDFYDGGGEENISVNGSPVEVLQDFTEVADLSFPGVEIELTLDTLNSGAFLSSGTLCLRGDIHSLLLGGQEFGVDNVCAQLLPSSCIGFEGLEADSYGNSAGTVPGTVFYEESDVEFRLAPFQSLFWTTTYGELYVMDENSGSDFSAASGQHLKFEQINLIADLTGYPETVEELHADFRYNGGSVNFAANGANFLVQFMLSPGFYALAPGVELEVSYTNNIGTEGKLVFTGNLQTLLIGGESDFRIDNLCVNPEPPCPIENLTVEAGDCNPNNVFDVTIEFDYAGSPEDTVKLFTNGNYQYYLAGDFPLTLSPFVAPTDTILFEVATTRAPFCTASATLLPQECETDCPLEGAEVVGLPACSNASGSFYQAMIELPGYSGPGDTVVVTSLLSGESTLALVDPADGNTINFNLPNTFEFYDAVKICLFDQPDCCIELQYDILCPAFCDIQELVIEPKECNDEDKFALYIDLVYGGTPTSFEVIIAGVGFSEVYSLSDFPLEIPNLPGNGVTYEVKIVATDCNAVAEKLVEFPDCPVGCNIEAELIGGPECLASGGYLVVFTVPGAEFGDELTIVSQQTGQAETVVYNGQILEIDFPLPPDQFDKLEICLAGTDEPCCTFLEFDVPCAPCTLEGSVSLECEGDKYWIVVSQISEPGDYNLLVSNGDEFLFDSDELPASFGPFPLDANSPESITVQIVGEGPCQPFEKALFFEDCEAACPLAEAEVVGIPSCSNTNGDFYHATIKLPGLNAPGDSIIITSLLSGETTLGVLDPQEGSLFDFNLPNTGEHFDKIIICLFNQPNCCIELEYDINCPEECGIEELVIDPKACDDEGNFSLYIDLEYAGGPTEIMVLIPELGFEEAYALDEFPIEIPELEGDGETYQVKIYATQCDEVIEQLVTFPACLGGCGFEEVIVEPHPCESGQFMVDVEVHVNEPGQLGYYIYADGDIFGPYSYDEAFVTVGPFEGDGTTVYDFLILDIENPACFGYVEVGPKECEEEECEISDVEVAFDFCDTLGFYVKLDFDAENADPNGLYRIFGNGEVYDTLAYSDPRPVVLGPFDPFTDNIYELIVADLNDPDCKGFAEFSAFDCEEGEEACITFELYEGVSHEDFESWQSFHLEEYGVEIELQTFGVEGYAFLSDTIPEFFLADSTFLVLGRAVAQLTLDNSNSGTEGRRLSFDYYRNPEVDTVKFYSNGSGWWTQDWISIPSNDTSIVLSSGVVLEFYPETATVGHLIIGFPEAESEETVLAIQTVAPYNGIAIDNLCVESVSGTSCEISNLNTYTSGCGGDGLYDLKVDFDLSNPGLDSFSIYDSNLGLIGDFAIDSLPVTIYDYGASDTGFNTIEVCIPNANNCCQTSTYEVLECPSDEAVCMSFDFFEGEGAAGWPVFDPLFNIENGIEIFSNNGDFCLCYIQMLAAEEVPEFETAYGAVAQVKNASLWFELPEVAARATFDFEFDPEGVCSFSFDSGVGIDLNSLISGETVSNGEGVFVTLNYLTDAADERTATIEVEGLFNAIYFTGSGYIDNFCYTPASIEVWPGDANADNIAHHIDLLNLGLAFGQEGPERLVDGSGWMPNAATDWPQSFADGTNYKHADCNGDGVVNEADRTAIVANYGLQHDTPMPIEELPATALDPPAHVDFPNDLPDGAAYEAPIVVGAAATPVQDVYGIAFTVHFDPQVLDPQEIAVVYPTSWFGEPGVNTMAVEKVYPDGRIEIAMTRTDQNNVSGHGPVAYIIGIIDDIAGYEQSRVRIDQEYVIDKDEDRISLRGEASSFNIRQDTKEPQPALEGLFSVFPNPTSDWVTIYSRHGFEATELQLFNLNGRQMNISGRSDNRISLEGLPPGSYVLQIKSESATVYKRIIKQ